VSTLPPTAERPEIENTYLTYPTRCRHPDHAATDEEIGRCDPFLNAEVRMINPEVLIPVGGRALQVLVADHTTLQESPAIEEAHATEIRGRGFLLVPMCDPAEQTDADRQAWLDTMGEVLDGDYRQPKGRRGQRERTERSRQERGSDTEPDP
jgi:uracil-DNA glycosylase